MTMDAFEREDLMWLIGWLARDRDLEMLPPRLAPIVREAKSNINYSRFTVAPVSLREDDE